MSDECITDILSSGRGHHDNHAASLLYDKIFCLSAREYVRKHACSKGEPNLTSKIFADWIHREYDTKIQDRTAHRWLAKLRFSQVQHQKGVYFDGHERVDVVACSRGLLLLFCCCCFCCVFFTKMVKLDQNCSESMAILQNS